MQGICKYEKKLKNSKLAINNKDYAPLHQPSGRCLKRLKKKALARESWFKGQDDDTSKDRTRKPFQQAGKPKKKAGIKASTVMFVPNTRNGTLLKMMREKEESLVELTGFRVSYTEAGGTQLGRMFSTNLATNQPCGRSSKDCIPCSDKSTELQN